MALSLLHRELDTHNADVLRRLKVGDMVEFPRSDFFSHWGVYLGGEEIVHITTGTGSSDEFLSVSSIGFGEQAFVRIENFWKVVKNSKAKINNKQDNKRPPRHYSQIVKEANAMVGQVFDFNVLWNNCEHFASYLRYGEKSSDQGKIATAVLGGAALAVGGFFGGVMAGALLLNMKWNHDKNQKK